MTGLRTLVAMSLVTLGLAAHADAPDIDADRDPRWALTLRLEMYFRRHIDRVTLVARRMPA